MRKIVKKVAGKKSIPQRGVASESKDTEGHWISKSEFSRLYDTMMEAQETLEAIRSGSVDAVVVSDDKGSQRIYSLAGAEHPYRVYVEQMQEGAVTVSSSGLILYCNQRFAEMAGEPLEGVISSNLTGRLNAKTWELLSGVLKNNGSIVKHEGVLKHSDGKYLPVHFAASPLPSADEQIICLVVTDLSAQKVGEELRTAKEVAEQSSLAKDSFLAALSHELRTPLTPALMAVVSLQHQTKFSAHVQSQLAMIRRNIELETRLIDDLLDLTRIASGKLELDSKTVDIHEIMGRAIEVSRASLKAKELTQAIDLQATITCILGDAVRLQQVFWNVLQNAIKFTPAGGKIGISTENLQSGIIRISVTDSGIGFDPDQATELFQAFEQNGRDITRQYGGLGLGLSISRSIVSAHGGSIWAKSSGRNKGAIFYIDLPTLKQSKTSKIASNSAVELLPSKKLNILLVEDHDDTRVMFQAFLEGIGHVVAAASTAEDALKLAKKEKIDLVISDLGLPDLSGLELMAQLRDLYSLPGIALSGYGMEDDIRKSQEVGFTVHLTKPIDPTKLIHAIAPFTSV